MVKELEILKKNQDLIKALCIYAKEILGFPTNPTIVFLINKQNALNPLARTAYYSPEEEKVAVYILNRHIKDILRSLVHELVHHAQHHRGEFVNAAERTEGYMQDDDHLREMEREAYEKGNMIFRDFEDGIKDQLKQIGAQT